MVVLNRGFFVTFVVLVGVCFGFSGGDGSDENPYQISTQADLDAVNQNLTASYILINDIDLSANPYTVSPIAAYLGKTPEGASYSYDPFTGSFDGGGFTITGLKIGQELEDYVSGMAIYQGLFGRVGQGAAISNLHLADIHVNATDYAGGIAGLCENASISDCSVESFQISGRLCVGGLVGLCKFTPIVNCQASGAISDSQYFEYPDQFDSIGGLIGRNNSSDITNCIANCVIMSSSDDIQIVGGLAGKLYNADVTNSSASVQISLTNDSSDPQYIGGLTGYLQAVSCDNCQATLTLDSLGDGDYIGGLAGLIRDLSNITNCSSQVDISSSESQSYLGGFCGSFADAVISVCSSTGTMKIDSTINYGGGFAGIVSSGDMQYCSSNVDIEAVRLTTVGGFVGDNSTTLLNCFCEGEIVGGADTHSVGGFCGGNGNKIARCYSDCNINFKSPSSSIAGFVAGNGTDAIVANCYCKGSITTWNYPNSTDKTYLFVGYNAGTVRYCYADVVVDSSREVAITPNKPSESDSSIIELLWNMDKASLAENVSSSARTSEQLSLPSTFLVAGWDLPSLVGNASDEHFWYMTPGQTPHLFWENDKPTYTVTFNLGENVSIASGELSVEVVENGRAVAPLILRPTEGLWWTGWDADLSNITSDMQVNATYEPITSKGDGTAQNPYKIATVVDFLGINEFPAANYILVKDVDFSGTTYDNFLISEQFTGTLDGDGFAVSNVNVLGDTLFRNVGIIKSAMAGSVVKNLNFNNCKIESIAASTNTAFRAAPIAYSEGDVLNCNANEICAIGREEVGGLIACKLGGTVSACSASGSISGDAYTGGLIGSCEGVEANNSSANVLVIGDCYSGGFVGCAKGSQLYNCYSGNNILIGGFNSGGFVGYARSSKIERCYSDSYIVSIGGLNLGGFVGFLQGGPGCNECYSAGEIHANSLNLCGGFVGQTDWCTSLTNCYSQTDMEARDASDTGGFVGKTVSCVFVTNCYSAGNINIENANLNVGGFLGYNYGNSGYINGCFWDKDKAENLDEDQETAKTTAQIQDVNTFLDAGWDFINYSQNGTDDIWRMIPGQYPIFSYQDAPSCEVTFMAGENGSIISGLSSQVVTLGDNAISPIIEAASGWWWTGWDVSLNSITGDTVATATYQPVADMGDGSESSPYLIATVVDFAKVQDAPYAYYKLFKDVDLNGQYYFETVVREFGGNFDGDGYQVSRLQITEGDFDCGLFGKVLEGAKIDNLTVSNALIDVDGYSCTGAIAGTNKGEITNCHIETSLVRGVYFTGGIAGCNDGLILNCDNRSSIQNQSGGWGLGGIAGENTGIIEWCISKKLGKIIGGEGSWYIGGLVGINSGNVSLSYSKSNVTGGQGSMWTGGFIGLNEGAGIVERCYSDAKITGFGYSQCLAGFCAKNDTGAKILNCYSQGQIGEYESPYINYLAGFCFRNQGLIENCYCAMYGYFDNYSDDMPDVLRDSFSFPEYDVAGGEFVACFYNLEDYEPYLPSGGVGYYAGGLTDNGMQSRTRFIEAGWDFVYEDDNGTEDIWVLTNGSFPEIASLKAYWGGDINRSGYIGYQDLAMLAESWLSPGTPNQEDINSDGIVDLLDFAIFSYEFMDMRN